jgi:hypothetical protein
MIFLPRSVTVFPRGSHAHQIEIEQVTRQLEAKINHFVKEHSLKVILYTVTKPALHNICQSEPNDIQDYGGYNVLDFPGLWRGNMQAGYLSKAGRRMIEQEERAVRRPTRRLIFSRLLRGQVVLDLLESYWM